MKQPRIIATKIIPKSNGGLLPSLFLFFFLVCNLQAKSDLLLQEVNKESLKDTKSLKSPIKLKDKETKATSAKGTKASGGTYPFSDLNFNNTTDELLALKDNNGNVLVYIASTKGVDASVGEDYCFSATNLTNNPKYYVQKYDTKTQKLVGEYINARAYYNGGHNFNAEYNEWGMPHSNSFGLWIKLTQYPKTDLTLFSRNEAVTATKGYRPDYFHFQLLTQGLLRVSSKITDYSVDSLTTQKPLPLNKWVYIQAIQNGVNYQIGWKSREGSENELVSKAFSRDTLKMHDNKNPKFSIQQNRVFDTKTFTDIVNKDKDIISFKEGFYDPTIALFALADNYEAIKEKLMYSIFCHKENGVVELLVLADGAYKVLVGQGSPYVTRNDFDIYYDVNTLNILVIDFRNNRKGASKWAAW